MEVDEDRVIGDPHMSFAGTRCRLSSNPNAWFMRQLEGLLSQYGYDLNSTYAELPPKVRRLYGRACVRAEGDLRLRKHAR